MGEQWLVAINQSKTVAMTFGQHTSRSLLFKGTQVSGSFEHKHLGVVLQSDLKWSKHLDMVAEKSRGKSPVPDCCKTSRCSRRPVQHLHHSDQANNGVLL